MRTLPAARAALKAVSAKPRWVAPKATGEWVQNDKGQRSDPVNVYLHGSLKDIRAAFVKAGWVVPTPKSTSSMLEYGGAAVVEKGIQAADSFLGAATSVWNDATGRHDASPKLPDPVKDTVARMPIAHLFYQGKPDVLSFERDNDPTGGRHHFRVFDTGKVDAAGKSVYAVSASLDIATVFAPNSPQQLFVTHRIDPNADKERDEVLRSLTKVKAIASQKTLKLGFGKAAPSGLHSVDSRVFDVTLASK